MFWIGIVFVLFASVIAFWIGRPIIWLSFRNEKFNAAFRYALVRLRDASEAVAFYRGEVAERTGLRQLFAPSSPTTSAMCADRRASTAGTGRWASSSCRCPTCCSSRGSSAARSRSAR